MPSSASVSSRFMNVELLTKACMATGSATLCLLAVTGGEDAVAPATRASRTNGFALGLLLTTALIELLVVAFASAGFDEVADASPFGRPGTAVVSAAIAVVALVGVAFAWRGGAGTPRLITAVLVFIAVGIVALMALFFIIAGGPPIILAVLLALTAVSIAMIGRAVLQQPARPER